MNRRTQEAGFVLDASIVMSWAFADEDHHVARAAARQQGVDLLQA